MNADERIDFTSYAIAYHVHYIREFKFLISHCKDLSDRSNHEQIKVAVSTGGKPPRPGYRILMLFTLS